MSKKDDDTFSLIRRRLQLASSALSETRQSELEDLKFFAGSPDNQYQWPGEVIKDRTNTNGQQVRPCLTINKLPQHVRQITNDQRQNRQGGKVIPVDDQADVEVAEIFDGIVRHIEYISNADIAYNTANENQVIYGEGYFRILTEYCDDNSFNQEIKIGRIRNSFSVYMDPTIQDPFGLDQEWCIIVEELLKLDYERNYPDASPVSTLQSMGIGDQSLSRWANDETVTIAEYFYITHESKMLYLFPGNVAAMEGSKEYQQYKSAGLKPIRERRVDVRQVMWGKTNGFEWVEGPQKWAGKWIPVIRVPGNEFDIEGKLHLSGIVRNAKDAQRMYNYWSSQEAEMLALAPKAPFIGYGGQFENYEHQWKTANTQNWPYLEVNPDVTDGQGRVLPLPQRAMPPMAQTGLIQAKMGASDDIKATTGQYDVSLGATSNERTGKAIMARERQTDTGTYHYGDNMTLAIRFATCQLVDLIPKIYDTQRIVRIIGEDGKAGMARIDPTQQEPVRKIQDGEGNTIAKIYNPSVGKYDVRATTGPSYMTKRQEALDNMAEILKGNPELWAIAGDLFVKHMDWPGSQELADRLAKTIDPKLLEDEDSPLLQAARKQIEFMSQEMEQMYQMLQNVSQSMEAKELAIKEFESKIKASDAETKRLSAVQAGMTPEQIQEVVLGTIHSMIDSGDLIASIPESAPIHVPDQSNIELPISGL